MALIFVLTNVKIKSKSSSQVVLVCQHLEINRLENEHVTHF